MPYDEFEIVRWVDRTQYVLSTQCDGFGCVVCFIFQGGYRIEQCPRLILLYDGFRCERRRV